MESFLIADLNYRWAHHFDMHFVMDPDGNLISMDLSDIDPDAYLEAHKEDLKRASDLIEQSSRRESGLVKPVEGLETRKIYSYKKSMSDEGFRKLVNHICLKSQERAILELIDTDLNSHTIFNHTFEELSTLIDADDDFIREISQRLDERYQSLIVNLAAKMHKKMAESVFEASKEVSRAIIIDELGQIEYPFEYKQPNYTECQEVSCLIQDKYNKIMDNQKEYKQLLGKDLKKARNLKALSKKYRDDWSQLKSIFDDLCAIEMVSYPGSRKLWRRGEFDGEPLDEAEIARLVDRMDEYDKFVNDEISWEEVEDKEAIRRRINEKFRRAKQEFDAAESKLKAVRPEYIAYSNLMKDMS